MAAYCLCYCDTKFKNPFYTLFYSTHTSKLIKNRPSTILQYAASYHSNERSVISLSRVRKKLPPQGIFRVNFLSTHPPKRPHYSGLWFH